MHIAQILLKNAKSNSNNDAFENSLQSMTIVNSDHCENSRTVEQLHQTFISRISVLMDVLSALVHGSSDYVPMRDFQVYERTGRVIHVMRRMLKQYIGHCASTVEAGSGTQQTSLEAPHSVSFYKLRVDALQHHSLLVVHAREVKEMVLEFVGGVLDQAWKRFPLTAACLVALVSDMEAVSTE